MEAPVALNAAPLNALHIDQYHLPLADRDFQIKDPIGCQNHLHTFYLIRNSHLNNSDIYGIWESNLPRYYLPSVNIFPDIIRHYYANYDLLSKAVMTPSQNVLFYILLSLSMKCCTSFQLSLLLLIPWDFCLSKAPSYPVQK